VSIARKYGNMLSNIKVHVSIFSWIMILQLWLKFVYCINEQNKLLQTGGVLGAVYFMKLILTK